uniref:Cytochrome c oxidase assembly factor 6 homolog n=1 Tax=Strongyloides venezuelensis TaxID=75913 RepID=A0A0K0FIB7_STRVS
MSSEVGLKNSRKKCYTARDLFLECFERNNESVNNCRLEYKNFEQNCPTSWVEHFIRKYKFDKYKEELKGRGIFTEDEKNVQKS